ncbi:hypothetical protein AAFP30_05925 [Gordonia sp. CPCC 205515]|uniref:TY-Chap domain-containing protein n=1 Tax=Gordonia sp. CPCC 205515 TaxID=3140791 RepID=UPI003AF3B39B
MSDFDSDAFTAEAWQRFQEALALRLSDVVLDDLLFVMPRDSDPNEPFALRFNPSPEGVRGTVACDARNRAQALQRLGWRQLDDGRFIVERPADQISDLVQLAVGTLQQIWSVADPGSVAYLGIGRRGHCSELPAADMGPDLMRDLIGSEIEGRTGGHFPSRTDGTIFLPTTHIASSIGVSHDDPRIDIFACLATDVTGTPHLECILAEVRRAWPSIELVVSDDDLYAAHLVDAEIFSHDRVYTGLITWFDFIDNGLPDLDRRLHPENPPVPYLSTGDTMICNGFDESIDDAWRAFGHDLGNRLADLAPGDSLLVEQAREFPEGPHGVLTFTVTGGRRVRCTVVATDLHPTWEFFDEQVTAMKAAGWRELRGGRLIYEVGRRRVDELARVAVDSLREIWEVVHPSFLADETSVPIEPRVEVGAAPKSGDHLQRMVIDVLEDIAKCPITVDEDGDVRLPTRSPSWLRVRSDEPVIEFFGTLIRTVQDPAAAAVFIATQSRRWLGIKLTLTDSTLMASTSMRVKVFHRKNLVTTLSHWLDFIDETGMEIVAEIAELDPVVAPTADAEATDDDRLPDPLQTLIVLDDDHTSLTARDVATICRFDQSAILRYIHTSQEQYLSWKSSADDADDAEEAAACRHEAEAWDATVDKLRGALRMVVLGDSDVGRKRDVAG